MTKVRKSNKKYKSRKNNKKLQKIQKKSKKYLYIQLHLTFNMCYEKLSGY